MIASILGWLVASTQPKLNLDAIANDPRLAGGIAAMIVTDLRGGVLYEKNADIRVMPASNQKVFSCAFALSELGAGYRPETRFWINDGNMVVDAVGDPTFTADQLTQIRQTLRPRPGAIISVRPAFRLEYPPSWEIDDTPFRYAPKIQALTYNRGAFEVYAGPRGLERYDSAAGIRVKRGVETGELGADYNAKKREITVRGAWPKERSRAAFVAMPDPMSSAARLLGGRLAEAETLPARPADHIHVGPEMRQIVKDCLEPSDNMLAEHLLLLAAGKRLGKLGSDPYADAQRAMGDWYVRVVGGPANEIRPYDGSGMSRHNLITSRAMARTLQWIHQQGFAEDFRVGLPSPGEGTLRSRLAGNPVEAKTGTIDLVSSLSGYVGKGERTLVFSVIFNHALCSSAVMRELQDKVVLELVKHVGSDEKVVVVRS